MNYIFSLIGDQLSHYKANTAKPLCKDEEFYFRGRKCFVVSVHHKGVRYEYCNIGIRNGSRLHGGMFLTYEYIHEHGSKPRTHWEIK